MIWFGQLALTLTPRKFAGISEKEGASLFLWVLKRGPPSSSPKGGLPFSFAFILAFLLALLKRVYIHCIRGFLLDAGLTNLRPNSGLHNSNDLLPHSVEAFEPVLRT